MHLWPDLTAVDAARREIVTSTWEPDELMTAAAAAATVDPPSRTEYFEVSPVVGIPASLIDGARRRAEAAGYAAGWSRGVAAARVAVEGDALAQRQGIEREAGRARNEMARAVEAVTAAAASLLRTNTPVIAGTEDLIVSSAFAIAEAVIGTNLRTDPNRGATAVARALALLPDVDDVTIALHPEDRRVVEAGPDALPGNVRLVDDPTLQPGDAVATSGSTKVDARIADGVQRVRAVLSR